MSLVKLLAIMSSLTATEERMYCLDVVTQIDIKKVGGISLYFLFLSAKE
jgi:hypothetical protein